MQQIKITLKDKNYDVEFFTGWLSDYRRFKELMAQEEENENVRNGYQRILNGLYLALAGLVGIPLLMVHRPLRRCRPRSLPG
jgi:hypothetical protein